MWLLRCLQNLCIHCVLVPSKQWVHQMVTVCHFTFSKPWHPQHTLKNKHEKHIICSGQQFCVWSIAVQRPAYRSHYCSQMRCDSEMVTDVTKYITAMNTSVLHTEHRIDSKQWNPEYINNRCTIKDGNVPLSFDIATIIWSLEFFLYSSCTCICNPTTKTGTVHNMIRRTM